MSGWNMMEKKSKMLFFWEPLLCICIVIVDCVFVLGMHNAHLYWVCVMCISNMYVYCEYVIRMCNGHMCCVWDVRIFIVYVYHLNYFSISKIIHYNHEKHAWRRLLANPERTVYNEVAVQEKRTKLLRIILYVNRIMYVFKKRTKLKESSSNEGL